MKTRRTFLARGLAAAGLLALNRTAFAHGAAKHAGGNPPAAAAEQQAWGIAGDPAAVARTVPIVMTDAMRFSPDHVEVRLGETIRFAHHNAGKMLHEFVIGTQAALDEHAALMKRFPDMEHDAPWMAHVGPGEEGEIVWRFNRAGDFRFGCLIPGHYEAGMVGAIVVRPA